MNRGGAVAATVFCAKGSGRFPHAMTQGMSPLEDSAGMDE
jgi:hypothetical protein